MTYNFNLMNYVYRTVHR